MFATLSLPVVMPAGKERIANMMEDYEGRPSPIDPRFPSQCKTMSTWGSRCLVLAPRSLGGSKRIPCDRSPPPTHPRTLANGGKYRPTTNFETSTSADPATGPIPLGIRGACTDTGNRVNAVRSLSAAIPMLLIARNLTSRSRNPAAAYRNLITISRNGTPRTAQNDRVARPSRLRSRVLYS